MMTCELNLQDAFVRGRLGHLADATWRATNSQGAIFNLCAECAQIYQTRHPDWKEAGMRFEKIDANETVG